MSTVTTEDVKELAKSLDCFTEEQLQLLAEITPKTAEAWRKRGTGPGYVLFGNRYLYPRAEVAKYLAERAKHRGGVSIAGAL